jgi:hypothetical protein
MTAADLLQRARGLGLQLEPREGGGLAIRPASKLPPDLADDLRRHKTEVIALLNSCRGWQSVPPLDLELIALKPGPTTARQELVIAYQTRQCNNRHLREWLTRRKRDYFVTVGKTWDGNLLAYAAARDAACWQLDRTESKIWFLLEEIESCLANIKYKPTK